MFILKLLNYPSGSGKMRHRYSCPSAAVVPLSHSPKQGNVNSGSIKYTNSGWWIWGSVTPKKVINDLKWLTNTDNNETRAQPSCLTPSPKNENSVGTPVLSHPRSSRKSPMGIFPWILGSGADGCCRSHQKRKLDFPGWIKKKRFFSCS